MRQLKAIILAAGEGSRMKSKKPKVLHEILNKSMVDYVMKPAKGCGAEDVCVVVGLRRRRLRQASARKASPLLCRQSRRAQDMLL